MNSAYMLIMWFHFHFHLHFFISTPEKYRAAGLSTRKENGSKQARSDKTLNLSVNPSPINFINGWLLGLAKIFREKSAWPYGGNWVKTWLHTNFESSRSDFTEGPDTVAY